jgi:hypothetical protein
MVKSLLDKHGKTLEKLPHPIEKGKTYLDYIIALLLRVNNCD